MFAHKFSRVGGALFAAAIFAVTTASAQAPQEQPAQHAVRYSQADFADAKSVAALYKRLQRASQNVCEELQRPDANSRHKYRACYEKALADAVHEVNEQTLTALHNQPESRSAGASRSRTDGRS
jgi:UrcA family protein